jgi:hypothetical protein
MGGALFTLAQLICGITLQKLPRSHADLAYD